MMMHPRLALVLFWGALTVCTALPAQADNLRVSVANLSQDVSLLVQQLKTLQLENEDLRREQARMRAQIAAADTQSEMQAQVAALSASIEQLRRETQQADQAHQQQTIAAVSRQIEALGRETQAGLDALAKAMPRSPAPSRAVEFNDDYPTTGKAYTVRSGDTLSGIARQHGSSVRHIQNANKISNPAKDLRVGATIFIPISE